MSHTIQIVFVPIVMAFFVVGLWVGATISLVCLIGTAKFAANGTDIFTSIQSSSGGLGFFYYSIFGSLWLNALLISITTFVVAATVTSWYFSKSPGV